jgi:hypothetical protein
LISLVFTAQALEMPCFRWIAREKSRPTLSFEIKDLRGG